MKLHYHKVPMPINSSFSIRHNVTPFGTMWHYHAELELHYIIKGEGVRFIGDNISNFSAGEFILLGQYLPHTWHCNEEYIQKYSGGDVEAIVLHFLPDCMGKDFLLLPEACFLPRLFDRAKKGMLILNNTRSRVAELIVSATQSENLERVIALLTILKILSETEDYETITKANTFYRSDEYETERLNLVCDYTLKNYSREINLEQIAAISNLTVTSFCRYFKLMTKKTYHDFLTEIRLSHACRHLIEDKISIPQIADKCGFNNISNFYRQFKKVIGVTPVSYKRNYLSSNF